MHIRYGSFQFLPGEATFSKIGFYNSRSPRGFRTTTSARFFVEGEICDGDAASITARINQIALAIGTDGLDIGLFEDNGTQTAHFLESNSLLNLTGNQVLYSEFPETTGGEYVDGRMFRFGVGAELLSSTSSIWEYQDTVTRFGNGGPDYDWRLRPGFGWVSEQVAPSSLIRYVHSGYADSLTAPITPPSPYYTGAFQVSRAATQRDVGPIRKPQGILTYRRSWSYTYILPAADPLIIPTTI